MFNKDHDTTEEGQSQPASLRLLCTVSGNQTRLDARTEFEILQRTPTELYTGRS